MFNKFCSNHFINAGGNKRKHSDLEAYQQKQKEKYTQYKFDKEVQTILASKADVQSELTRAITKTINNTDKIKVLVGAKANVNAIARNQRVTPLNVAIQNSENYLNRAVPELIRLKANVNQIDRNKSTPLSEALNIKNKRVVRLLLQAKATASINQRDFYGTPPIFGALYDNSVLEMLLRAKANVNQRLTKSIVNGAQNLDGYTPLHFALIKGPSTAVKTLIDFKADVDIRDPSGRLPVDIAQNDTIRQILIDEKARKQRVVFDALERVSINKAYNQNASLPSDINEKISKMTGGIE